MPISRDDSNRLLEDLRAALRVRHRSPRTIEAYLHWLRRFLHFHDYANPRQLEPQHISAFISDLASRQHVSASTQTQALSALVFLYRHVLHRPFDWLEGIERAKKPLRLPVVLTRREIAAVLDNLQGTNWLLASLLYGSGLRLLEACSLRVKDLDLERREITLRDGKGRKDRHTVIAENLLQPLHDHLAYIFELHQADLAAGAGYVSLPDALSRKLPNAPQEWPWQWVFPANRTFRHPRTGHVHRHHIHETSLQKAVRLASQRAQIPKRVTCHSFRGPFGIQSPLDDTLDLPSLPPKPPTYRPRRLIPPPPKRLLGTGEPPSRPNREPESSTTNPEAAATSRLRQPSHVRLTSQASGKEGDATRRSNEGSSTPPGADDKDFDDDDVLYNGRE